MQSPPSPTPGKKSGDGIALLPRLFLDPHRDLPRVSIAVANYFSSETNRAVWGPRTLHDMELILHVRGRGEISGSWGRLDLDPGEILLIPPGVKHTYRCHLETRTVISCIHFTMEPDPRHGAPFKVPGGDPEVPLLFKRLAREWVSGQTLATRLCEAVLCEILARLDRSSLGFRSLPIPLQIAMNFFREHYRTPAGREDAAEEAGVTPEHLSFLFRKHLATSPIPFRNDLRFAEARRLILQERLPISEAARRAGWEDPLFFSRAFRKRFGQAPSRLRE